MPVVSVLIPRFGLLVALEDGGADEGVMEERCRAMAKPVALAPEPGAAQLVGEVSERAEAMGVRAGMRVGEALSRCPELSLIPPDSERAERSWERVLRRLEGIGAEVESERPGEAFFEAAGLQRMWGGLEGVMAAAQRQAGSAARLAAAPGRFGAYVAASAAGPSGRSAQADEAGTGARRRGGSRASRYRVIPEGGAGRFLRPLPVSLLHGRLRAGRARTGRRDVAGDRAAFAGGGADGAVEGEADDLPNELERLGIATLGRLAELPRDAVADRFGRLGLAARALARGEDEPLRPRPPGEAIGVEIEIPEAALGQQLERALELLVARLLAHPGRGGRSVRALSLSARLAAGGGWRRQVALRTASAERERLAAALTPHLSLLPGPATVLRLEATAMGPASQEQLAMSGPDEQRRRRISEAVRQTRAAAGGEAVLRVLEVDPSSRIPERRDVLMPFPHGEEAG